MIVEGYGSSSEEENDDQVEDVEQKKIIEPTPTDNGLLGTEKSEVGDKRRSLTTKRDTKRTKKRKKNIKPGQDPASKDYVGPWAKSSDSSDFDLEVEEVEPASLDPEPVQETKVTTEAYTTEPYMEDTELKKSKDTTTSFRLPTKTKFTLKGHSKGITRVRFFPRTGHLVLSSGNDGKIYLWSLKTQSMLRGFFGHFQSVKDIVFNSTGDKFLSAGVDRKVLLWDTKTGEILRELEVAAIPTAVIFNPNNDNEVVVGLFNRRIEHYDLSLPAYQTPIQIYDHHLGAINSLTVVDSNLKFMSTSDDRTIRFWDWQINIPTKIIADPTQHSTPYAAVHPTESFIALQMMDNSIQTIQGSGKFRYNRSKVFLGHRVAGYGIEIAFSPDGQVLISGDIGGYVYFWNWKSGRVIKKLKVSESIISCVDVNPGPGGGIVVAGKTGDLYYVA